jgi:mannose-6-phosphate isomerase-like protein (cupin superfamily)
MIATIDLEEIIETIDRPWSPVNVAQVNDQVARMALFQGEYHWHRHKNEDELFYVYRGNIVIQMKGHPDVALEAGQLAVVPKSVEHRPRSPDPSYVLMFEPYILQSKGDR